MLDVPTVGREHGVGLSESEITARLAALRRQREALDREIADLVLYLELGRRLGAAGMIPDPAPRPARSDDPREAAPAPSRLPSQLPSRPPSPDPSRVPDQAAVGRSDPADDPVPVPRAAPPVRSSERPSAVLSEAWPQAWPEAHARTETEDDGPPGAIPPPVAFTDDAAGARRYGRAVVQAACRAIAQAGRPLHAAEILEVLLKQGFTLPGRDPVAALNTRLWKRTGPGGPLCRVGEATYALAGPGPSPA
jgi:hypothetical protein